MNSPDVAGHSASAPGAVAVYRLMFAGSMWAVALAWTLRGIGLVNTAILARILAPEDFGLVAMATLAFGFIETFTQVSSAALIIRERPPARDLYNTAWTMALFRGGLIALVLVALSPLIADYFNEPRVVALLCVVALNAVIAGGFNVGVVLLRKELDFRREFYFIVVVRLVKLLATVSLALVLRNYWALLLGVVVATLFECWFSYRVHPYRPQLSLARAKQYIIFSFTTIPMNIGFYLTSRIDSFIVGRAGGAAALGVYGFAAELSTMLTTDMMGYIQRALYPGYAALREDPRKLADAYLLSLSGTLIVSIAFGAGLYAVREDFVAVLLGPKWLSTIPLIEWLSICAILRSIGVGVPLLMATGRERTVACLTFLRLGVVSSFALAGAEIGGVQGVAIGLTAAFALLAPTGLGIAMGIHGISLQSVLRACWRPVIAGLVMVMVVRTAHLDGLDFPTATLFLDVLIGAFVFTGAILLLWALAGRPRAIESMLWSAVAGRVRAKGWA